MTLFLEVLPLILAQRLESFSSDFVGDFSAIERGAFLPFLHLNGSIETSQMLYLVENASLMLSLFLQLSPTKSVVDLLFRWLAFSVGFQHHGETERHHLALYTTEIELA